MVGRLAGPVFMSMGRPTYSCGVPARFDLTRVRLRQYRSIAACDVRLGRLSLLVGPNGSGKSNFLDALRFTAQSLNDNLDNALRERGGINELRRRSRGHPTSFGVGLNFSGPDLGGEFRFQVGAVRGGDFRVTHESCSVTIGAFGGQHHAYSIREGDLVDTTEESVMPPVADDRLYLVAAAGLEPFRAVFDALSQVNVYSINPEEMRRPQKPEAGDLLRRDGSNVASVLERLRREQPAAKSRIEGYLGQIVAGVTSVDRRGLGAWEALEFRQQVAGDPAPWTFQASSMSDGTLSALGVLVALFGGSSALGVPLGIEEPEAALHPAAAGLLMEALRDATDIRQVLTSTHSPELLDSTTIEPEELLAVRASEGITSISGLDSASRKALRESLFTAGELLRVDQLEPERDSAQQLELFR